MIGWATGADQRLMPQLGATKADGGATLADRLNSTWVVGAAKDHSSLRVLAVREVRRLDRLDFQVSALQSGGL